MSDDIFHSWKESRYIVAPEDIVDPGVILIVLSDYTFWNNHFDEMTDWCRANGAKQEGMTVVLPNPETLTAFTLRWR